MKIAVILNRSAGSLLDLPPEATVRRLRAAFEAAGVEVEVAAVKAVDCSEAIRAACATDVEAVVVGGGDGTIATAANLVIPSGKALGVLPLGTMNLLARDLGIPLEMDAAVAALANGTIRAIDVAEVNGEVFLNNSVLGLYPAMVQERERQRGQHGLRKWPAMALAALKALWHFPLLALRIDAGSGPRRVRTPVLAVSTAPYDAGYGPVLRRSRLDAGVMGVYLGHHRSPLSMLRLLFRMTIGTWAEDEELDTLTATTLTVHSNRRRLRVANDGEVRRMKPPLVYRIHPGALKVLVPGPEGTP